MKIKRLAEMSELERSIMLMVWGDVERLPEYSNFRSYQRDFIYENKPYVYKCKYRIEDGYLRLKDSQIEHAQEVISIIH